MCESFLTDEKVVQRISQKVYESDKGLWNTIKKWFEDLVAKLKKLFADLDPQSENGRIVREMGDRLDAVRQMWADMVVEAGTITTEATQEQVKNSRKDLEKLDADYLSAVERGDMETAQRMVDEAAKKAGYNVKAYHGTKAFGFTQIDTAKSDDGISFFATDSIETAGTYSVDKRIKRIVDKSEYVSDEQIEQMEENGYDIAVDIAEWCNRQLGIMGWADDESIHQQLENVFNDAQNEMMSNEDISSKIYEIFDDIYNEFSLAYHEANYENNPWLDEDEYMSWEDWEASEENEKLSDKFYADVDKIINVAQALLNVNGGLGIYSLYMNTDNHLVIDCKGEKWNKISADNLPDIKSAENQKYGYRSNREYWTTRSIARYAKDNGYNGVTFKNVIDTGSGEYDVATVYISFNPRAEVKSADPATYDDRGNVIPLSQRFNAENEDIRYSHKNSVDKSAKLQYNRGTNYQLSVRSYTLDEIAQLYDRGNLDAEYGVLFNRAYKFCETAKIKFAVVPEIIHEGKKAAGVAVGRNVELSQNIFNDPRVSNRKKSQAILHEMIHTSTVYAIVTHDIAVKEGVTSQLSKNVYKAAKEIYTVYSAISKDPKFKKTYGIKNAQEMTAELSNPEFVNELQKSYPSPWHKLVEAICELFGIKKKFTNYAILKKAVERLLADPDYALAEAYYDSIPSQTADYTIDDSQFGDFEENNDVMYSRKTVDPITSREELAKALSKVAKGEDRAIVESYKANVNLIKGETERLESLRKEIDEIKYKKSITYEGRELSVKEFEQIAYTRAEEMGIDAERVKK